MPYNYRTEGSKLICLYEDNESEVYKHGSKTSHLGDIRFRNSDSDT